MPLACAAVLAAGLVLPAGAAGSRFSDVPAGAWYAEAVETALRYHAHSVLLAHNHPSGEPQPSHLDIQLTEGIRQAMELIGIRVRDHFIACGDHYISLSELGLMPKRK